ncbi:hypothetical protein D0T87_00465 [Bacteroides sp. 51]|nr:hypothetical protein [Bacteroides sp. 51]
MILSIISIFCFSVLSFGQAKKPTLMVVPSDNWCATNGYMTTVDMQGAIEQFPDYENALLNNNLTFAISKIGELMSSQGFDLQDLGMVMKNLRNDAVLDDVTRSSEGNDLAENARERLMRVAKADIIIQLSYHINKVGPKYSLTYNMQGIDAYTEKQIAAASGTGEQIFSGEFSMLLEKSIVENIGGFQGQFQDYLDKLQEQGREVRLECRAWNGNEINFESDYGGEELGFLIEEWMADNTVQGRFSTDDASENRMTFSQVRIPLVNERGRAVDTRLWANGLRRWLKEKYSIEAKLYIKGLGKAIIMVGEK